MQCYKCAAIVLKDEIEAHLIQVHDCHIKGDFGPIRQNKCELCGRAYIKVDYFQKVYSKNLTDYSTLKVNWYQNESWLLKFSKNPPPKFEEFLP